MTTECKFKSIFFVIILYEDDCLNPVTEFYRQNKDVWILGQNKHTIIQSSHKMYMYNVLWVFINGINDLFTFTTFIE